nr:hypothetical protein [uncultured Actinoplanes sp.]
MHSFELTEALAPVPGIEVSIRRGALNVHVPELGDTVRLDPDDVDDAQQVFVPTRRTAVQLDVRRGRSLLPLIVTEDDLVFSPVYAQDLVERGARMQVPAMPGLIAYSEMHRDVRAFGRTIDDPAATLDPPMVAGTLLAHRCFLAGAVRMGLWPIRVAAWWEYAFARVGGSAPLPAFRADEAWDALMADVTEARKHTA